MKYIFRNVI